MNEKQTKEAATLRAAMEQGRSPSGHLEPKLRERVVAWLAKEVALGTQQRELARSLGIHEASVSLWLRGRRRLRSPQTPSTTPSSSAKAGAMLAVSVVTSANRPPRSRTAKRASRAADAQSLALVTPHGYRIEGIDVTTAIEILRGLA